MFITNLNLEQQAVLLALAEQVMESDGIRHQTQEAVLETLKHQVNEGVESQKVELEQLNPLYDTHEAKVSLVFELIGVAYANGEFDDKERDIINSYTKVLGLSESTVNDMVEWVKAQMYLMEFSKKLLAGNGSSESFSVLTDLNINNNNGNDTVSIQLSDDSIALNL